MTIEVSTVDIIGWRIEAGATVEDALTLAALAFLPDINLVLCHSRVEWNDSEGGEAGQAVQLRIKSCQHIVRDRARLVNTDSDVSDALDFAPWMNLRVPLVKTSRRGALVRALRAIDEPSKDLAPVDF